MEEKGRKLYCLPLTRLCDAVFICKRSREESSTCEVSSGGGKERENERGVGVLATPARGQRRCSMSRNLLNCIDVRDCERVDNRGKDSEGKARFGGSVARV